MAGNNANKTMTMTKIFKVKPLFSEFGIPIEMKMRI